MYDYIIVGAGFFGATCAYELNKLGRKILVLDKRNHIGGNAYTSVIQDIVVHKYGAHIFHTNSKKIWDWINQFGEFNNFVNSPIAMYQRKVYSLPFNMYTFNQLWGISKPNQAKEIIESQRYKGEITNLEEQALSMVGTEIYEKLIKGYTTKQWGRDPKLLPASIIKRIPIRYTYNNNYFEDRYQGIPIDGYTKLFERMLDGIPVELNVNYLDHEYYFKPKTKKIIYTGPLDSLFNYKYGRLEYRSLEFENSFVDVENAQGNAVVNYTNIDTPMTRSIEHKHFNLKNLPHTIITYEYPKEYTDDAEPYYPINDTVNNERYQKYLDEVGETNLIIGGRLAEYKYYDMHQVIASALKTVQNLESVNLN